MGPGLGFIENFEAIKACLPGPPFDRTWVPLCFSLPQTLSLLLLFTNLFYQATNTGSPLFAFGQAESDAASEKVASNFPFSRTLPFSPPFPIPVRPFQSRIILSWASLKSVMRPFFLISWLLFLTFAPLGLFFPRIDQTLLFLSFCVDPGAPIETTCRARFFFSTLFFFLSKKGE